MTVVVLLLLAVVMYAPQVYGVVRALRDGAGRDVPS